MMSTLSFYAKVMTGKSIDLATAFTVLIFFDKITGPMQSLPWMISGFLQLIVSMKRIEKFLNQDELVIDNFLQQATSPDSQTAIKINKSSFSWGLKTKDEEEKKDDQAEKEEQEKMKKSSPKSSPDSSPKSNKSSETKKKTKRNWCFWKKKKVNDDEDNQKVSIDSLVVLKDIELQVKKGEFVCIIGDVGAGKSSLLSSIIGDLIPVK